MKEIKPQKIKNPFKKIFIKLCRLMGYEIIDQNNFYVPTSNKDLNQTLSVSGKKSISLPLGEVKISRKVKSLDVIIRTCSSVNMLTQSKKRIFEKDKIEYTLRSINSILRSVNYAKDYHPNIKIKITVVDHNSSKENLEKIKNLLKSSTIQFNLLNLDISEFKNKIKKINEKNEETIPNQISNMSNIYKSLMLSKLSEDLVYFVEDDYIHELDALTEMLFTYERIASLTGGELIICPTDYPYLYVQTENTNIYLGEKYHWRKINETLCTFLTSRQLVEKYWDTLLSMCTFEHYPFESPLHAIYKRELCVSPIPSIAIHCTNINSIYGLSPNKDWKKIWDENKV
jgi:predicted house-cleaning noncanonical NTP pyrophosphatase (MazG superfamily)|tara:strand:- start:50 stop:1078 length:1029 start_codon:yes stop_codon:yes gene_type:complete